MSQDLPPPPARRPSFRLWVWLALAAAFLVSAVLYYRGLSHPAAGPPDVDLAGVDPEVAEFIQSAREEVAREPSSAEAWGTLGGALHAYHFHPEAVTCYARAEDLDPNNPDWPYLRGVVLLNGPSPTDAAGALRKAAACPGAGPLPQVRLGELYLDQGRPDEAAEQFQAAASAAPHDARPRLRLAQIAASRGRWRECLEHLQTVSLPGVRKQVCSLRLRAFEALGDTAAAQAEARLLAELPEDSPWPDAVVDRLATPRLGLSPRLRKVVRLLQQGDPREALPLLDETVQRYPESASAWYWRGWALARLRQFAQAERAFQRSLELERGSGDTWFYLGLSRLEQKKFDEALTAFGQAARLRPTDAESHCMIGHCWAGKGERTRAVEAYREALRYQPGHPAAKEHLARLSSPAGK